MHQQGEQASAASVGVPARLAASAPLAAAPLTTCLTGTTMERPTPPRPPVECGELPFLIKRDGLWLYRGSPIGRKELVCLFASVLKRDEDGQFWLETPAERGRIEVEDAPFVAVEMDWAGCGREQCLTFRTNVDERICRAVYYELAALAEPGLVHGRRMLGVWSRGRFFPLGEMVNEEG